jgi:hypothetical protein
MSPDLLYVEQWKLWDISSEWKIYRRFSKDLCQQYCFTCEKPTWSFWFQSKGFSSQFSPGLPDFCTQYTKTGENIPNYHNLTKWPYNWPNGRKILQMTIKIPTFAILRPSKIYPNWDFLVSKHTIWQPWFWHERQNRFVAVWPDEFVKKWPKV